VLVDLQDEELAFEPDDTPDFAGHDEESPRALEAVIS
jgi:hypothetical protein